MDRVFKLVERDDQMPEPSTPVIPSWNGEIEFKNVWFAYVDGDGQPDWVLRDVSFTVQAGERVAFVGATGREKLRCQPHLSVHDFQEGQILIDGVEIRNIPGGIGARIEVMLQDVFSLVARCENVAARLKRE